jgi:hypothetical protein
MRVPASALIGIAVLLTLAPLTVAGPPSWDSQINAPRRFKVLNEFAGAAVLDGETGLVWEQAPDGTNIYTWAQGQMFCTQKTVGNRKGWRLPTIQELASLVDPNRVGLALPGGHPFSNLQEVGYWSATSNADTSKGWMVDLFNGNVFAFFKTGTTFVWCVRGGQGVDPQ